MEKRAPRRHDFWDDLTDQICATIIKESISYDPDCLERMFAQAEQDGQPIANEPSLEQVAEDKEYAESVEIVYNLQSRPRPIGSTENSTTEMAATPSGEADLKLSKTPTSSIENTEDGQRAASDLEVLLRSNFTPTHLQSLTHSSSRNITPGLFPDASPMPTRKYLNDSSPTPAAAAAMEAIRLTSSPTTQTASNATKSLRRKLSFGVSEFGGEDQVKMPPPKLRKTSPTVEDLVITKRGNAEPYNNPRAGVTFKDITPDSTIIPSRNDEVPKTPMLMEVGFPPSPAVIEDDTSDSYPTCLNGLFEEIPSFQLRCLRKTVDPDLQDDRYWGDRLYFSEEPVCSQYFSTEASRLHSMDWRIIFHALDNAAEKRVPLPDTHTKPHMSDEHLHRLWLSFKGVDKEKATHQAQMPRDWTVAQMAKAGIAWTEIRATYDRDALEFATTSSQDICADQEFRSFCSLAQFDDGRAAAMPKGMALRDSISVLKYTRMPKSRPPIQHPQQLLHQHSIPEIAALLRHDNSMPSYPSKLSTPATSQSPSQVHLQDTSNKNQATVPAQNTAKRINRAFQDIRVFLMLPQEILLGLRVQWLQIRTQQHVSQGLPVPTTAATVSQLWQFFRARVQHDIAAKTQREARERIEAQKSMVQNSFVEQPGTPVLSGPVQSQSHTSVPRTSVAHQAVEAENMMVAVTSLGSPYMTPRKVSDSNIDPQLLSLGR